jgi:catalase
MLNNTSLPPDDPYAPLRVFADMAKAFADPAAFQERMEKLIAQEQAARTAIAQAKIDVETAAKAKQAAEQEISAARAQWDFQQRHESDVHRDAMAKELAAAQQDRNDAAALKQAAEVDAAEAARIRADLQRRIRLVTEAA